MDAPVPADYTGDGIADIATFRSDSDLVAGAAQWFILPSDGSPAYSVLFGGGGGMDAPVPADYTGDGIADIATFRSDSDLVAGAAQWFILPSDGSP
ncbi:VCBS repeat-containing protein, partial [Bremerella sp. JC817]|uniref:FG-GAP repeat domain-containing protein n=1 Tax=Bremerella sp. JC817 TaxID=3231756 RepID=UPI0034592ACA